MTIQIDILPMQNYLLIKNTKNPLKNLQFNC